MMNNPSIAVGEPSATNDIADNPAQLSTELGALFPTGVVAVELTGAAPRTVLTASELAYISHCAQKRIDDFTRGRACAHRCMTELGLGKVSLLSGEKREPLWPPDIIGSITHTTGFAAAVVARRNPFEALGIDCEVVDSVGADRALPHKELLRWKQHDAPFSPWWPRLLSPAHKPQEEMP